MQQLNTKANVLIIDDHDLFLDGIKLLLSQNNEQLIVFSANNTIQATKTLQQQNIDLMLVDLDIPGTDGLTFVQSLLEQNQIIPFCILSATDNPMLVTKALKMGASGFIPKSASGQQMMNAIDRMLSGEIVEIPPAYLNKQDGYTTRQLQILQLLANGLSNKEIARELTISAETIKSHLKIIFQKMQVSNRTECIAHIIKKKVI
ncbi:response regulator [Pelagibaculum spongiae]|uniref:DNA-binding response regulator n=1 Tax=Pelagibaculum spongiae TaxID=2080658 RepID=A0A2V1GZH0_9GAMM|nr:response regulator transcription factor [Pelagibaculum spongiae]PVZ72136.1 DNA-binding response regulator [Pelagibaculum spongiae]